MSTDERIHQLAVECSIINSRLRACHAKSILGFYENALELAARAPGLMNELTRVNSQISLVRASSSPEVLEKLDSDASLRIDEAYLGSLQETYDKAAQIKPLLQSLRKLVLARALAPSRLSVMREMLSVDPSHPFLDEDIRNLERSWFKQVVDYCLQLAKNAQTERIREVIEDFRNSGYAEPIPQNVVIGVRDALKRSRLTRLPSLENEILSAHRAQDLNDLQLKFSELEQLVTELSHSDPGLEKRLYEARRWMMDRQADFKLENDKVAALADLEKLLQSSKASRADISAKLQEAESLGVVDEALRARAHAKMENNATRQKKTWLTTAIIGLLLASAIPTSYVLVSRSINHNKQVQAAIDTVNNGPRQNQRFDEAISTLDGLPPEVSSDKRIVGLRTEIEDERREFAAILSSVATLESPEKRIMLRDDILEIQSDVSSRISRLQGKKKTDGSNLFDVSSLEKTLQAAVDRREATNKRILEEREATIQGELASWTDKCSTLRAALIDGLISVDSVETSLVNLQSKRKQVSEEIERDGVPSAAFSSSSSGLDEAVSGVRKALELSKEATQLLQKVRDDGIVDGTLKDAFELHQRFSDERGTAALPAEVRHAYFAIEQLDGGGVSKQLADQQSFKEITRKLPLELQEELRLSEDELKRIELRDKFRETFLRHLERKDLRPDLWISRNPEAEKELQNNNYFISKNKPSPGELLPVLGGIEKDVFPANPKVEARPAAQIEYRSAAIKLIESSNSPYELVDQLYKGLLGEGRINQIDPILRLSLVASLLKTMEGMSSGAQKQFESEQFKKLFQAHLTLENDIASSKWALGQAYKEYKVKREACEKLLSTLPKELNLRETARRIDERLAKRADHPYRIIGLLADTQAANRVLTGSKIPPNVFAKFLVIDPENSKATLEVKMIDKKPQCNLLPVVGVYSREAGEQ